MDARVSVRQSWRCQLCAGGDIHDQPREQIETRLDGRDVHVFGVIRMCAEFLRPMPSPTAVTPTTSAGSRARAAARLGHSLGCSNCTGNDCSGKTTRWSSGLRRREDGLPDLDILGTVEWPWQPPPRVTTFALALVVTRPQSDGKSGETVSVAHRLGLRRVQRARQPSYRAEFSGQFSRSLRRVAAAFRLADRLSLVSTAFRPAARRFLAWAAFLATSDRFFMVTRSAVRRGRDYFFIRSTVTADIGPSGLGFGRCQTCPHASQRL